MRELLVADGVVFCSVLIGWFAQRFAPVAAGIQNCWYVKVSVRVTNATFF